MQRVNTLSDILTMRSISHCLLITDWLCLGLIYLFPKVIQSCIIRKFFSSCFNTFSFWFNRMFTSLLVLLFEIWKIFSTINLLSNFSFSTFYFHLFMFINITESKSSMGINCIWSISTDLYRGIIHLIIHIRSLSLHLIV